jgi:hypothetical protein
MSQPTTRNIEVPGAMLAYDVREPETPDGHRPLFVLGTPMAASGFGRWVSRVQRREDVGEVAGELPPSLRACGKLARMCRLVAPECSVPPPRSKPSFLSWIPRLPSIA